MNQLQSIAQTLTPAFFILYIWSLIWKGLALWKAADLKQKNWFVAMLILNTIGILEIAYLFFFAKKKMKMQELMFWKKA
jgi:methionyl-tRNA synthetase